MLDEKLKDLSESGAYKNLCQRRAKTVWPMAIIMLAVYYAYILVIAFAPEVFANKIGDGHMTLGMAVGLGVILFTFIITGIYVHRANVELEPMVEDIQKRFENGELADGGDA